MPFSHTQNSLGPGKIDRKIRKFWKSSWRKIRKIARKILMDFG
jgi:hypothetical protein